MPSRLAAIISKHVAFIISGCAGLLYVANLFRLPIEDFASIGLSAFAIVAGLAGVCYTQAPLFDSQKDRATPLYAAEKFLHSSVLLLQALFLKYAQAGVLKFVDFVPWLHAVAEYLWYALFLATGSYALYFFTFGLDELNVFLWDRYLGRLKRSRD